LIVSGLTVWGSFTGRTAEPNWEYSVQVSATVDAGQPKVTLSWPQDSLGIPNSYTVYRKSVDAANWGPGTTLSGATTTFTDTAVQAGQIYEYAIDKVTSLYNGSGYICVGVNAPLVDRRGKVVLVVDASQAGALASELTRLQQDLVGDGWTVVRHDVNRNDTAVNVKNLIRSTYQADPGNVKAVFLFGHVPVPYSGNIVPDGHYPDHQGAWPADAYYGDMDGGWTDNSVYNTAAYSTRNHNVPGDGKFDQSTMPSAIELQVGRVDLANMPGRTVWGGPATLPSETELLRQYLNKDHNFRHKLFALPRRALVHDSFGARNGEAFVASAYRSYAPLLGPQNVTTVEKGQFIPGLAANGYLMSYGAGAGSYAAISGIGTGNDYVGTTLDIINADIKSVFTMLMGSWLGDWDSEDNIMRSVLATKSYGLACAWSGRPHWFFHHMGIGETLGYSARLTQNNGSGGLYRHQINNAAGGVHIGLMGDPTLRLHPVGPASNLQAASSASSVNLTWSASTDGVQGYHVYRATSANGPFTRVTSSPVNATSYTDGSSGGATTYMVRAVKLETTTSGAYYNASQGIFATVDGAGSGGGGGTGGGGGGVSTVSINVTAPPSDATVSGAAVTVSATPSASVLGVQFKVDGANIGSEVTTAPYSVTWNSTTVANGAHQLTAVARVSAGVEVTSSAITVNVSNSSTGGGGGGSTNTNSTMVAWVDDTLPSGALAYAEGGDVWNWINANPAPTAGARAHQSTVAAGLHQHFFEWASQMLSVGVGDTLFAHVYLDPANMPRQIMLQWSDGSWEHRAYWGENLISYGTKDTTSRKYMGPLPAAGQWVRLDVPASAVALEGKTARGMAFTLYGGRATWDAAGKYSGPPPTNSADVEPPTIAITEPANNASVSGTVKAAVAATDNVAVAGVQYKLDGANLGSEITTSPYGLDWDTTKSANGSHTLTAVARDAAGNQKTSGAITVNVSNSGSGTSRADRIWFDDQLPAGARPGADGGDTWNWITSDPSPNSGASAHQSIVSGSMHQHFLYAATDKMAVGAGDVLFAYVYLDPANPPSQVMLQWNDGAWDHRAYWGADRILYGVNGTESRKPMGAVPALGRWVRLEVPASAVGLEGKSVSGVAFSLYGGRATWDTAGVNTLSSGGGGGNTNTNTNTTINSFVWVDDRLPPSAISYADGGDSWNWISANPAPISGSVAHQSSAGFGQHQHFFDWTTQPMEVAAGDTLYAYVYLDPANLPSQIMLQWNDGGSWDHRAYWGANRIQYGFDNTTGRRNMGALPPAGQWVRLEVPAASVGMEGRTARGMAFTLFDGRATWDAAGKASVGQTGTNQPGTTPGSNSGGLPVVTVSATKPNAAEQGAVAGEFTLSRSGATTDALTVLFTVAGSATAQTDYTAETESVTFASGETTATLDVEPVDDSQAESLETVVLSLTANSAYSLGVNKQATITIADNDSSTTPPTATNAGPEISVTDYAGLAQPKPGDHTLHVLSPTLLELQLVTKKDPDPAPVSQWNFVDVNNVLRAPASSEFTVTIDGATVPVQAVGFKRRALSAPITVRDLRVLNHLYLKVGRSIGDNQTVEVKNPSGALWNASTTKFEAKATSLRYSPAIHVNQEGYMPAYTKKAMVGYFTGSFGEMDIPTSGGFKLVDSASGAEVFQGTLKSRPDIGFTYSPTPYQKVYEADFSAFKQPGEYRLVVPGMGASLPFLIDEGIAMGFTRTFALGLYHQRCGGENKLPFTRHEHANCHMAQADVPLPSSSFPFTWNCVASKTVDAKDDPRHTAIRLMSEATQLYPIINRGKLDVSGGHHDAGDYSKYTISCALLTHYLMFGVDSLPGVAALDNLGLPNSGDGISDILQEAKWEADYIAKIQDADGGFYFLTYPRDREYEGVLPDQGDPQVVWPKNTAATAAAVAALAQMAGSPLFKKHYPAEAARYLEKAKLGWQFLMNAIAKYGKDGSYQKVTHYGHDFMHDDELAWAASELFVATGEEQYHQQLKQWFNPSDPATFRWGWMRLYAFYGNAIRAYAFAARSGRLPASKLDAAYLAKCEEQVVLCAEDQAKRSRDSAYGTGLPMETKAVRMAGWYFSAEHAFDLAVGYQIQPKSEFIEAILANLNYEGGGNPVNVSFVTGLGWKRPRDVVSQYAFADHRNIPPSGIPIGNFTTTTAYSELYKAELRAMDYPDDEGGTAPYPMYDRWSDSWNVIGEYVHINQARSLSGLAFLSTLTQAKDKPWKSVNARIIAPEQMEIGKSNTVTVQVEGKDLNGARIVWEARDTEPGFGREFTIIPKNSGDHWIEAEIQWPDGCRAFARHNSGADGKLVVWVDDEVPAGASAFGAGGDSWNWVSTPAPQAGSVAHESAAAAGLHQHWFHGTTSTLQINTGDTLFAYVYIDPANPPVEIMLQWYDGTWNHRAYWGANQIAFGDNNTVSRRNMGPLPAAGQWVKLEVPASAVGLEGKTINGIAFTLFNGRAYWDSAGRSAQ
jgi:glycosyl hydrolase family 9/cellulase-like Ig domain-containing protein/Big-like domain-containing protein/Calx-beta domain-containing protein